ncbi:MAG: transglutaminase-like cysteine peptidase [Rhizobiaceae bacterium]|nr:transglutaminase-like cysteine peptidase [Rhizobiaceae bacterium]
MRTIGIRWGIISAVSFLAAFSYLGGGDTASADTAKHMDVTGRTSQPIGHYFYCLDNPDDCKSNNSSPIAPVLKRTMWKQMVDINNVANSTVEPLTDLEQYNQEEYWTLPGKFGDCEDYVLLKRKLLMEKGFSASSLLITVVKLPDGNGHAVLTVRTAKADYVLDSLNEKILPWNKTEYLYLKRQSTLHAGQWIDIRDSRDMVSAIK